MTINQEDTIKALKPLMHKALNYQRIYFHHPDFEDYLQNLNLKTLSWLAKHPDRNPQDWQGHLFNHFCWSIKNMKKQHTRYLGLQEKLQAQPHKESYDPEQDLETKTRMAEIDAKLTRNERKFLRERLAGQTIADIAKRSKVSRPTVYKWKKGVQQKFENIDEKK